MVCSPHACASSCTGIIEFLNACLATGNDPRPHLPTPLGPASATIQTLRLYVKLLHEDGAQSMSGLYCPVVQRQEPDSRWLEYSPSPRYKAHMADVMASFYAFGILLLIVAGLQHLNECPHPSDVLGHVQPLHRTQLGCEKSVFTGNGKTPDSVLFISRVLRTWIHFLRHAPVEVLHALDLDPRHVSVLSDDYGLLPLHCPTKANSKQVLAYCKAIDREGRTLFVPLACDPNQDQRGKKVSSSKQSDLAVFTSLFGDRWSVWPNAAPHAGAHA